MGKGKLIIRKIAVHKDKASNWISWEKKSSLKYLGPTSIWETLQSHSHTAVLMKPASYRCVPFVPWRFSPCINLLPSHSIANTLDGVSYPSEMTCHATCPERYQGLKTLPDRGHNICSSCFILTVPSTRTHYPAQLIVLRNLHRQPHLWDVYFPAKPGWTQARLKWPKVWQDVWRMVHNRKQSNLKIDRYSQTSYLILVSLHG